MNKVSFVSARLTNDSTNGFEMASDGLLMREFGFRGSFRSADSNGFLSWLLALWLSVALPSLKAIKSRENPSKAKV